MDTFFNSSSEVAISNLIIPLWGIILIIVLFFFFTLYFVLPWLSEQISLLGIYHRSVKESYLLKIKKVLKIYFNISIPLLASYIVILFSLNIELNITTLLLVVTTGMITLVVIRIHGNPSENTPQIKYLFPIKKQSDIIEQHRERILSFIFSLIAAQIIFALLSFAYTTVENKCYNFQIEPTIICLFVVIYIFGLIIISLLGEIYLYLQKPIHQID